MHIMYIILYYYFLDASLPIAMKMLTVAIEKHVDQANVQVSILVKLVVTRCINSAVLVFIAVSYYNTFQLKQITAIQNILLADAIITPLTRVVDPLVIWNRYVLSQFVRTQTEMNILWYLQSTVQ